MRIFAIYKKSIAKQEGKIYDVKGGTRRKAFSQADRER